MRNWTLKKNIGTLLPEKRHFVAASIMSIPPNSWDAAQGGDFNARFGRMNVNAQPFVPNVGAQPFVPGVYPPYGYPGHGMCCDLT